MTNEVSWHGSPDIDPSAVRVDVLHAKVKVLLSLQVSCISAYFAKVAGLLLVSSYMESVFLFEKVEDRESYRGIGSIPTIPRTSLLSLHHGYVHFINNRTSISCNVC